MAEVRGCLPRFLTHHECLRVYETEGIDDDFAFDGLDGVDDDGDGAGVSCSKDCWVLMSTEESQQPKPGWEWYQPTTVSGLQTVYQVLMS